MTTRQIIERYFEAFGSGGDWASFLDPGLRFSTHTAGPRESLGRDAYIGSTTGFRSMVRGVELLHLTADDGTAAALSRYDLEAPDGRRFTSDVAEFFTVAGGLITGLAICFDPAPYPRPASEG
jgi:ketosteroid isomerase-like protein